MSENKDKLTFGDLDKDAINNSFGAAMTNDAEIQKNRNTVLHAIYSIKSAKELREYLPRLDHYAYLEDLRLLGEQRVLDLSGRSSVAKNDAKLPEPLVHDHERAPLRDYWVQAAAIVGPVGSRTLEMVRRWGYRDAMLRQLMNTKRIGTRRFIDLRQSNVLHFSAEYLMRKHYSEFLKKRQIARIDEVLAEAGCKIES